MKKLQLIALGLSFIIITACTTFQQKTEMSLSINIPGGSVQLSGNPILVEGGTTTVGMTKHYLLCKVTCTDGSIPGGPWVDSIQPLNGSAKFDISGLVDGRFDYEFDINAAAEVVEHDLLAANITVDIGESYIDVAGEPQETWNGSPESMTILKGKLSKHEFNTLSNDSSSFFAKYITAKRFLTCNGGMAYQSDAVPVVHIADPADWVKAWVCFPDDDYTSFVFKIWYTDGSDSGVIGVSFPSQSPTKLYEINLHKILANHAAAGKTVEMYQLKNAVGKFINVFNDNVYHENHDEVLIVNRFSGVEVLHCYGETTEIVDTNSNEGQNKYKLNTGFCTLQERRWIKDLLAYSSGSEKYTKPLPDSPTVFDATIVSKQAWFKSAKILNVSGKSFGICPAVIVPGSFEIDVTSEDLKAIEFEIELAHVE